MRGRVRIIDIADREQWDATLRHAARPAQTWDYARGLCASGYKPQLAIIECDGSSLTLPFYEREWQGCWDVATLPCMSGATIVGSADDVLKVWEDYAVGRGWIAGYVQLAPSADGAPPSTSAEAANSVFLIDVPDWSIDRCSRTIRRKIASLDTDAITLVDDRGVLATALARLYPESIAFTASSVRFSQETLTRWVMSPFSLPLGAAIDGEIEAVHIGFVHGRSAEWNIAATSSASRSVGTLLYIWAIPRLREKGVMQLNLGGGARRGDGIADVKQWLGGREVPLYAIKQIYNQQKYQELCAQVAGPESGFFPAYRRRAQVDDG